MNKKNRITNKILFFLTLLFTITSLHLSAQTVADKVVAIVNDRIILKSEVDREIADFLRQQELSGQDIPFSKELWFDALESIIDDEVLLEKAKRDSVIVTDEQVNRRMDQRIQQLIRQAGSERSLEETFGKSIIQLKADFREQFREQMVTEQVRITKSREINITRPEVEEFFNRIPGDSIPMIPEMVALSQIVAIPDPLEDAKQQAFELASQLRDSVTVHGKNFEEMARKYSDGPSAPGGGLLPLMPISDLVSPYSAAATALEPGEISQVVETRFGFHVIRLNRRIGDNIETNHILIEIDNEELDEQAAIDKLNAIRDSVLNHDKSFREMAVKYSEDDFTKSTGGRLFNPQTNERLLPISALDPSMYRIVLLLEDEGQISEPRSFNPQTRNQSVAFRIVRLDQHISEHKANLKDDYERIKNFALSEKQARVMEEWMKELRSQVYIEYKIDKPELLTQTKTN